MVYPLTLRKRTYTKSHHRLAIARPAAAAIERVLEAIWTIQNEIWYYVSEICWFFAHKNPISHGDWVYT
ncbi:MAG: hypothetical protein LBT90_01875 [Holosporaceae bacterium]|nr:hypothetical protein [Holosporaceae bacterium]